MCLTASVWFKRTTPTHPKGTGGDDSPKGCGRAVPKRVSTCWYYILIDALYLFILGNLDVCGCHIWKSQPVMSGPLGIRNGLEVTTKAQTFVELWPTIHTTSPILCPPSGASRWIWHSTCGPAAKQKMLTGINCTSITIKHVDGDLCFLTRTQTWFWWLYIFLCHWRIVVSFCRDFSIWNSAWNLHNIISQCICEHMIHRVTLKVSQLNVCDTPTTLRLGCSVKLDDGVYEESDWLQVSSCHGPSRVSNPWDDMGSSWSNGAAPYALVILRFHHQNSIDIWYMFCEEDNHIW